MNWEQRRMLERAGILRRRTPNYLLNEGDDEGGGDDLFGDDAGDDSGDDSGGDDLFGDDGGDDAGSGDESGDEEGGDTEKSGPTRVPPEELSPADIEQFGSPRFLDVETKIKNMFNDAMSSAGAASQNLETYPGQALEKEPTPAKDGESSAEKKEKNESFYRYGSRRDKWLINEATRLLSEAEEEGSAADIFDMERFCTELANYMDTIHNTEDIEAGIFNGARQMVLNNFGKDTEREFVDMLSAVTDGAYSFLQTGFEGDAETPVAVGGNSGAAGA